MQVVIPEFWDYSEAELISTKLEAVGEPYTSMSIEKQKKGECSERSRKTSSSDTLQFPCSISFLTPDCILAYDFCEVP